ncbi:MAG: small ribosomal subunit Rsm22 family protein [candidate division FCPU426 bacterium]
MPPKRTPGPELDRWWPRLTAVWREAAGLPSGPSARLSPDEERTVVRGMQKLSHGLTRERRLAGEDYFRAPDLLGAYLLYFWPLSYLQAFHTLRRLPRVPQSWLELGAGAGPLAAAAFDLGARRATFADRSRRILRLADRLAQLAGLPHDCREWNPLDETRLSGSFDAIGFQHVLNELWSGAPDRIRRRTALLAGLRPLLRRSGWLVILEPALTATSRDLLHVRNQALAEGFGLAAPCLTPAPCPALVPPVDSCHQEWEWQPGAFIKRLIIRAGFKKETLKASLLVLTPAPDSRPEAGNEDFLIVSERMRSKNGRWRFLACGPAGRVGLALHPRDVSDSNRVFPDLRRGDLIRLRGAEASAAGFRLTSAAIVTRLHPHT